MSRIGMRAISALIFTAILALLFWLRPELTAEQIVTTPNGAMIFFTCIFMAFLAYMTIQGYPVSHGNIGTASEHNLDNIVSGVPAVGALFGFLVHIAGFWPLSSLNLMLAFFTLVVVGYDLWILGGAAAKINRLTDEFKPEK